MKRLVRILRDPGGATAIEMAFAFPILVMFIWAIYQFGLIFRANSGIQHALGEGARYATLWPTPANEDVRTRMSESVYGIGPGDFTIAEPVEAIADGATYLDLQVNYQQNTNLLLAPGPRISITKRKRVWIAGRAGT